MTIAPATAYDLDAIDEIERHSFKSPWPRAQFEGELAREWARIDVARDERGRVIAFCDYWIVAPPGAQRRDEIPEKRAAEGGELHVLVMATHPDHRGRGVAGALLAHVLAEAARAGCTMATLEVRAGNGPAIALYERAGFKTIHVRARYYQDDGEDALVMMRGLSL